MLRFRYQMKPRRMAGAEGPGSGQQGRMNKLRKVVTKLFRFERYEGAMGHCDEARGYAELLIQRAIQHGDTDRETMNLADHWLLEKDLIHKLFKVFVPRYQSYKTCVTNVWTLPTQYPGPGWPRGILELKGNPWPPVLPKERDTKNLLTNILLEQARIDYQKRKERRHTKVLTENSESQLPDEDTSDGLDAEIVIDNDACSPEKQTF